MDFSIPNATPCILLPASPNAPLIAYDAHTLADLLPSRTTTTTSSSTTNTNNAAGLSEEAHAEYLHQFLRLVVDPGAIGSERMETYVKRAVQTLVGCVRKCGDVMGKNRIASRAGIVIMKVRASLVEELDPDVLGNGVGVNGGGNGSGGSIGLNGNGTTTGGNINGSVSGRTSPTLMRTWSRESVRSNNPGRTRGYSILASSAK